LIGEVRHEPDRLIKRLIPSAAGNIAAGVGRLSEVPPLHLLVLVAELASETGSTHDLADERTSIPAFTQAELPLSSTAKPAEKPGQEPLRFSWRTDREGRLSLLSEEFLRAFGEND